MSELDKVMVATIKQSTAAMKRAGINGTIQEAETAMNELEDHVKDIHDLNALLAAPLVTDDEELPFDEELEWLEETCLLGNEFPRKQKVPAPPAAIQQVNSMEPVREVNEEAQEEQGMEKLEPIL